MTPPALADQFSELPRLLSAAKHLKTILLFLSRDLAAGSSLGGGGDSNRRGPRAHPAHQHDPGCPL